MESNGESQVRATLESHFISPRAFDVLLRNPFGPDDYEDFVAERQSTVLEAIEDLLVKERLGLPTRLRELDVKIESIELALRSAVSDALGDEPAAVPTHIAEKISERIRLARRKNPRLDVEYFDGLAGMLEYADLRELEGIVKSKTHWTEFEGTFGSKGTVEARFNQLAELRNGIRHSRSVDEVTRMDGEAAITWFSGVLQVPLSGR